MLIGARGLQGLFGALLAPSVLSLLSTTFTDPRERGRAFGIYATIAISGAAFGLILGGFLTQYLDWRWCLYVNLPIAALVAFGAFTLIPARRGTPGVRLDLLGVVLGCGGLVALVYGLGQAGADGWRSAGVVGPLIIAVVLLVGFTFWQSKGPNPLLPLRVLKNRNRAGSFLTIMLAVTGMFGTFLFLTYLLQTVDHYSPLKTGVAFLPLMAMNGVAATQLASRLMPHVRTRLLVVPGLLIAAAGVLLLTQLTPESSYVTHVLPAELLLGLGLGTRHGSLHQHGYQQRRPTGRRGHIGNDDHVAADRGLNRHGAAQHHRRHGYGRLSRCSHQRSRPRVESDGPWVRRGQ